MTVIFSIISFLLIIAFLALVLWFIIFAIERDNNNELTEEDFIDNEIKTEDAMPDGHILITDDLGIEEPIKNLEPSKLYYSDETITRKMLIEILTKNSQTGLSRLKKEDLLKKFHELNLEFPEVIINGN